MKTLYKAGYLIRITSWENDGDNYNTKEIQVATDKEARAVTEFAWLFKSQNRRGDSGIGNMYEPDDAERSQVLAAFQKIYEKHPGVFDLDLSTVEDEEEKADYILDYFIDYAYDLGLSCGEFYTRVCEKVEVLYFPQDVVCEDKTAEFKN